MVYREVHRLELRELLRNWQARESIRTIAGSTGLARDTVDEYLSAAEELGITLSGPAATDESHREEGGGREATGYPWRRG